MARVPSIPMRKPDIIDKAEELIGAAVEAEWSGDPAASRQLLAKMDREADELAKRK